MTRRAWAVAMIAKAPEAPLYGSQAWLALPDGPAKVAAVVRAAEAWATHVDETELDLRAEVDALRTAWHQGEAEGYRRRSDDHRADVARMLRGEPDPALEDEIADEWRAWTGDAS